MKRITTLALAAAIAIAAPFGASAFPDKPVTLVVGFSPGGGTDTYARTLAGLMQAELGAPVVVVNQPGAAGMIAASQVAQAAPDGHTLYMASAGSLLAKFMYDPGEAPADPLEDFDYVGVIGASVPGLLVPQDSPYADAAAFIEGVKADPEAHRWAHPGRGSLFQLTGAAVLAANGVSVQDVPFKGGSKARNAVAGEQVDFGFMGVQLKNGFEGEIRALGVAGSASDPANPDVPTFASQGVEAPDITNPQIVMGPKGLPENVAAALVNAVEAVATSQAYADALLKAGLSAGYESPEAGRARIETMRTTLEPIVERTRG